MSPSSNSSLDFPGGSDGKVSAYNVGDPGSVPGSGRSPGEGNGNPLQYSCLENPWMRSLVDYSPWGHKELGTTEQLHFFKFTSIPTVCFPGGSDSTESTCNAGDLGLIPGLGRSPGGGNGNPLQYSFLENPMDRDPSRLQSMELHRAGHDWATKHTAYTPQSTLTLTHQWLRWSYSLLSKFRHQEALITMILGQHAELGTVPSTPRWSLY